MNEKIDQRIVEMSFENQKFEKGISESKSSLKEFANALKRSDVDKSFTGLESSVAATANSFSMLEQIGIGALRRIGEMAVNAGAQLLKNLTVDQLSAGWTKYAQKTASVQTILNATGKSIEEVNEYLDELLWYSDQTSYGFTDMTAALGQMSSSGGKIEKLVPMIMGVANATAYAGKGAAEFSRVMYNLNQSYGMGYLEFRDWRSVEMAGVGGRALKQTIIDTAKELGKLDETSRTLEGHLVSIGTFGTTLKDKWADTEVMEVAFSKFSAMSSEAYQLVKDGVFETTTEAMESLAGKYEEIAEKSFYAAQKAKTFKEAIIATMDAVSTGWMVTFEVIFGQLHEATENFTKLADALWTVFASGAKERNDMLKWIKAAGGIANVFAGLKNVLLSVLSVLHPVTKALDQIFPERTKEQWLALTVVFKKFTEGLILTGESGVKVQRTFAGLFAIIDIGWKIVKLLATAAFTLARAFLPIGGSVLDTTAAIGDFIIKIHNAILSSRLFEYGLLAIQIGAALLRNAVVKVMGVFSDFVHGLWDAEKPFEYLQNIGKNLFDGIIGKIKMVITWLTVNLSNALAKVSPLFDAKFGDGAVNIWTQILTVLKNAVDFIGGKATLGFKAFGDAVNKLDFKKITTFVIGGILLLFVRQISDLTNSLTIFTNSVSGAIRGFTSKFLGTKITNSIRDVGYALGLMSASLWVLSRIPIEDLNKALRGLGTATLIFVGAYGALLGLQTLASKSLGGKAMVRSNFQLIEMAAGLIIISVALERVSKIPKNTVWTAVGVVGSMMAFTAAYQLLGTLISTIPHQHKITMNLLGASIGILALVGTLKLLNHFSATELQNSLAKMAAVLAVVSGMQLLFAVSARVGGGHQAAASMVNMMGGITAMVLVLGVLAAIPFGMIARGASALALITILLAGMQVTMGLAAQLAGGHKVQINMFSTSLALIAMTALVAILGNIPSAILKQGLITLSAMMGIIVAVELLTAASARLSGGGKAQMMLGSVALMLSAFTASVLFLGVLPLSVVLQGTLIVIAMVGLIAAIEIVMAKASKISGANSVRSFASLIGAATAIVALTGAIALLAVGDQEKIREAATSLAIASLAIGAVVLATTQISGYLNTVPSNPVGFVKKIKALGAMLVNMGLIFVMVGAFFLIMAGVMYITKNINNADFAKFILGLGIVTSLVLILGKMPISTASIGTIAANLLPGLVGLGAVLVATGVFFLIVEKVLSSVSAISWSEFGKFIVGLGVISLLAAGITLMAVPLAAVAPLSGLLLGGVLVALSAVALIVAAVVSLAKGLDLAVASKDILLRGLDLLAAVGEGIGRFAGVMIGAFVGGTLEGLADTLVNFVNSLSGFTPESLTGIKTLAEALAIISGTAVLSSFAGAFTGSGSTMDVFGKQLSQLIELLKAVPAADVILASATLAAMEPMIINLKAFAEAARDIPNSGGFVGFFMGNNDIDHFGVQLAALVNAFANVPLDAAGFAGNTLAQMVPMIDSLKKFATFAHGIPASGGFLSAFFGSTSIATFAEQIHGLIGTFGTIDQQQLSIAGTALKAMNTEMLPAFTGFSELANGLKPSVGIARWFNGTASLADFGKDFKNFVVALGNVDYGIVAPAMDAMSKVAASFEVVGAKVLENARQSFLNNKASFQSAIASVLDEPTKGVEAQKRNLSNAITSVFTTALNVGRGYSYDFYLLGEDIITGLANGIQSKQYVATQSVRNVARNVVSAARDQVNAQSPSKVFETIGGWCTLGLANGITKETNVAVKAGVKMAVATEEAVRDSLGVHSLSAIFAKIGSWLPTSISSGIQTGTNSLLTIANQLGINTGNMTLDGVLTGVAGGTGGLTEGISALMELLMNTSSPAAAAAGDAGMDMGDYVVDGFGDALGGKGGSGGLGGSGTQAIIKTELDKLKAIIEKRQFYGTISVDEELELYQILRERYAQGSEEREAIDREVYTRLKTMYDAQMSYITNVDAAQKSASDARTKLNDDHNAKVTKSNQDAAAAQEKLQNKKLEDEIKARIDSDKKIESETKKYSDSLTSILERAEKDRANTRDKYASDQQAINAKLLTDIDTQNKAYESAVQSRTMAIYQSYGLFSEVGVDTEVTGETLLKNLQDQGAAFSEWKQSLAQLSSRGVGDALIEELQAMGPTSKGEIKALLSLTDAQLTEYVTLFSGKFIFARKEAEDELEGLKDSTTQNIQDLNAQTAIDLNALAVVFSEAMTIIDTNMATDMSAVRETYNLAMVELERLVAESLDIIGMDWSKATNEIAAKLSDDLRDIGATYNDSLETINSDLKTKLTDLQTTFSGSMKTIQGMTESELDEMIATNNIKLSQLNLNIEAQLKTIEDTYADSGAKSSEAFDTNIGNMIPNTASTIQALTSTVKHAFSEVLNDFEIAGYNAAEGFARGIRNGTALAISASEYLALSAVTAARTLLNEHSPSKIFEGIGKFVSMGFANGIADYAYQAAQAGKNMAKGPLAMVTQALAEMEESNDFSFTITPVLDLSAIKSTSMAQLLSKPVQLGKVSSRLAAETNQNGTPETLASTTIINKFDLTGLTIRQESDIDAIATKLYQKQQTASRGRGNRSLARA